MTNKAKRDLLQILEIRAISASKHFLKNLIPLLFEPSPSRKILASISHVSRMNTENVNTRCRITDNFLQINYIPLLCAMKSLSVFPSSSLFPVFFSSLSPAFL